MAKTVSLDELNEAVDKKYESLVFDTGDGEVELKPLLRCTQKQRDAIEKLNEDKEAVNKMLLHDYAEKTLAIVAGRAGHTKLKGLFGEDRSKWEMLWLLWVGREDLGEASDSPAS